MKLNLNLLRTCFYVFQFQDEKLSCICKKVNE